MRHARTRAKVISVIRAFWVWAEEEGYVAFSPASKIRRPPRRGRRRRSSPRTSTNCSSTATRTARDRLALLVLLDCGVRRAELAGIRIRDFDLARQQLTVFGKGQKERVIPLRGRSVMALRAASRSTSSIAGQSRMTTSSTPRSGLRTGGSTGPTRRSRARPTPCTAGGTECSSSRPRRPRRPLGSRDLRHQDQRDLERAMDAFAEAREPNEEAVSRGSDSLSRLD
jgi:integrase